MKLLIFACGQHETTLHSVIKQSLDMQDVVVVNNIEAKNIINSAFEPEPLIITRTYSENFEVKLKDIPRNKFFDKPKNNFKK